MESRRRWGTWFRFPIQATQPVIVKHHVIGNELTAVLPVNSMTQMNNMGTGFRKFPACCQVPFHILRRVGMCFIIKYFRVQCPIITDQPFHPGRINVCFVFGDIRVKTDNVTIGPNNDVTAILRCAEFIPPRNVLIHFTSLSQ